MPLRSALLVPLLCVTVFITGAAAQDAAFFEDKVLPVLKAKCFECHSHNTGKMKGGLTLDSRSGWQTGGNTGPAVIAGKPEESLLIKAVRRTDKDLQMPPKQKLSDTEVALLEKWIAQGAVDPRVTVSGQDTASAWWAMKPLTRTAASIDACLPNPSPEADRRTLIRRLTFDLHGLPPTPEDVDTFVDDTSPDAYARLVDRLLASPRYGERFARLWLDVAHYGESNGFGMDRPRLNAWPYRDYVIAAINADRPYARFVQEQLAADALFPEEPPLVAALGFVAAGPFNQSALAEQTDGTDCKRIALNLDRDDMVSSVAATFLSVTLHCARCHEHKFDPISQRDYYRMQSVFAGVARGEREFDTDPVLRQTRQHWLAVRKQLETGGSVDRLDPADQERLKTQLTSLTQRVQDSEKGWIQVQPEIATTSPATIATPLPDGSVRFEGEAMDKDSYTLTIATSAVPSVAAVCVEVIADDTLPHRGPGRQPLNGNLHLSEVTITAGTPGTPVKIKQATADFDQAGWEAKKTIDGKPATAWGIHPQEGQSHAIVFTLDKPVTGGPLVVKLDQVHGQQHVIGRLRVSLSGDTGAKPGDPELAAQVRSGKAGLKVVDDLLATLPPIQKVYAIGSQVPGHRKYSPPKEPYPIHILRRGEINNEAVQVKPGALECVGALQPEFDLTNPREEGARRAALARWITDASNPLTWRSIANRVWQWHFGTGLVATPNDFGKMGALPSHPELLDWLACELRDTGSLKHLHQLIVTSRTYRQTGALRRLDAEQLRDSILAITGRLDTTMGGPSAMQFNYSDPNKEVSPRIDYELFDPDSPSSLRRGVYRFLFRNITDPLLEAFDVADPSLSVARRNATITPLQALSLYHNPFILRQSEHLAARLEREAGSIESQLDRAFLLLYSRRPASEETLALSAYVQKHGLASACRVLINSNEFLFVK